MDESSVASVEPLEQSDFPNMNWIPGGTFRMGSDKHYPEEAPVHRVTVSGFWIDRTPVTNRQFKQFVRATGHKTFAEIPPDPKNYPGALPHMLYAGSLVFTPPHRPVDLKNLGEWWVYRGVQIGAVPTGRRAISTLWTTTPLCMSLIPTHSLTPNGRARSCRPRLNGNAPPEVVSTAPNSPGAMNSLPEASIAPIPGREISQTKIVARTVSIAPHR